MLSDFDFEVAIDFVLKNEGGLVDNPHDTGGATNFGITQEMLDKFSPGTSVSIISVDTAKALYKKFFWDPLRLQELPRGIATAILDTAVNEGQNPAVRFAQDACGLVPDGVLGSKTIACLNGIEVNSFLLFYVGHIQDRYADIVKNAPTQAEFLKGWLRRSLRLLELLE